MTFGGSAVLERRMPRIDALTGLRWWAAFAVFLFHMRVFAPLPGPIATAFNQGYFGVTFFFVLSGFVLTWSLRPGVPLSTFYWRRFARIWPAHIVALLFAVPVFYTLAMIPEGSFLKPFDVGVLLLSVLVIQGWWANPAILFSGNPAAWTLTVEFFFYALHPFIARILLRFAKRGALVMAGIAVAWAFAYRLGVVFWPVSWLTAVPMPVTRLPEFVLGMAIAWAIRAGWRPRVHPVVGVGALLALLCLMAGGEAFGTLLPLRVFGNEFVTVAVGLAIVSLAARALDGKRSGFESRWQVKLGEWSFAFYLVHATVIYLALRVFGYQEPSWRNLVWFAGVFLADLLLAWMLYRFIEHPLERLMRRWKDARDAKQPVDC